MHICSQFWRIECGAASANFNKPSQQMKLARCQARKAIALAGRRQVYWNSDDGQTYVYDAVMQKYSLPSSQHPACCNFLCKPQTDKPLWWCDTSEGSNIRGFSSSRRANSSKQASFSWVQPDQQGYTTASPMMFGSPWGPASMRRPRSLSNVSAKFPE